MSEILNRYLRRHTPQFHLGVALLLAFVTRTASAFFVYGPQALDDYNHGVWPAYQMFAHSHPLDLPDYRSHLLNWLLAGFIEIGHFFGADSALAQVRTMYLGLALVSLLAIWGAYVYGSCFRSKSFQALSMYLIAVYPLMPFLSTRAFGESVALAFVVWGLALCEHARLKTRSNAEMFAGYFILGIAVFFRFQVGVLSVFYIFYLLSKREWRFFATTIIAGVSLLGAQAAIDWGSGKFPFETLVAYLEENKSGAVQYGVSPWYDTWILVLGLTLFPFSLVFARRLKFLVTRQGPIFFGVLLFVFIHSLVAHKEERFMYPIVGLLLIMLAYVWVLNRHDRWTKRIYWPVFLIAFVLILPVACFVNSQAGEIEPAARAERKLGEVAYIDYESLFQKSRVKFYFLRPPSRIFPVMQAGDLSLSHAEQVLTSAPELKGGVLLTSIPEAFGNIRALANQSSAHLRCGEAHEATSPVDRLLYWLNPKHNERRRPTLYIICERK